MPDDSDDWKDDSLTPAERLRRWLWAQYEKHPMDPESATRLKHWFSLGERPVPPALKVGCSQCNPRTKTSRTRRGVCLKTRHQASDDGIVDRLMAIEDWAAWDGKGVTTH